MATEIEIAKYEKPGTKEIVKSIDLGSVRVGEHQIVAFSFTPRGTSVRNLKLVFKS
jgi:tRNA threonylcarbamoyladenosine modification (KEOPS) complex Cgi121 subunit